MSFPHHDCAVQTSGLTLVAEDVADARESAYIPDRMDGGCSQSGATTPISLSQGEAWGHYKSPAARRHLAKYEPHQLQEVSDEIQLGWDCGICLETAEDPCVTRCGHLYCMSHLNHWLSDHPSCPVCKTFCTSTQDVVPIFSRGRTSPVPSSVPSTPTSLTSSDEAFHDLRAAPPTPQSRPGSPAFPTDLRRQWPNWSANDSTMSDYDYDIMPNERVPTPRPLPRVPASASYSPLGPHPHPLMTSYILAHYLGIALRIIGVVILLGVLLH